MAALGLARLLFWRRRAPAPPPAPERGADPRADALRAKLDESKAVVGVREDLEVAETPIDEADPDERRRRVHEAARAAVEEMRASGGEVGDDESA
jgi:hypothetical protein